MRFLQRFTILFWFLGWIWLGNARPVAAHPMGNFSINHLARFEARRDSLALRYILDFAEIPTAERMPQLDKNGDNKVSSAEKTAFLRTFAPQFLQGLKLKIGSQTRALHATHSELELRPGAGGLDTLRVTIEASVPLQGEANQRVEYEDTNFSERAGWMEVVALAAPGQKISRSNAATTDSSRGLTVFPLESGVVPPRRSNAVFTIGMMGATSAGASMDAAAGESSSSPVPATNDQTPQNRFTQSIAQQKLTPGLILSGLLAALLFGAAHALSPGHGKTMVAAYLVGSRGTPRHAVLLGLVVTITHTFGVFALGFALLFASRYVLPERLFPALSAASGLLIFGVGLWLLITRWQGLTASNHHSHDGHSHDGHSHDGHSHDDHNHVHEDEDSDHHHEHSHGGGHVHSHGGKAHSHAVPDGPITMKTLIALGISGGIVPCPEALVVLLAAVKLHRLGYGMLLITAFSIGLAAALIAIGMLVVSARERLSRFDSLGEGGILTRYLPIGSAAIITFIGAVLTLRATSGAP